MKHKLSFFIFFIIILSFSCAENKQLKDSSYYKPFHLASKKGDIKGMAGVVKKLVEKNIIRKGMNSLEIEKILGTPVHFTGIYVPGGMSYGFGNLKPSTENYYKFYWIHFKPKNDEDDDNYVLYSWD
jgi:hypothetical protein